MRRDKSRDKEKIIYNNFIIIIISYDLADMRIEDLFAFVLVVENRGFSRAAETLRLTQPALSQRIRKLEDSLGVVLIDRASRVGRPTKIGETFLPIARRMLADFQRSEREIRDIVEVRRGVVTIAANMTATSNVIPQILSRFAQSRPDVEVRIEEDSTPPALQNILVGEAEFGIVNDHDIPDELSFEALVADELVVICHRDHAFESRSSLTWKELAHQTLIQMSERTGTRRRFDLLSGGVEVRKTYQVHHSPAAIALVRENLGITIIPRLACMSLSDAEFAVLPVREPTIHQHLGIAVARGRMLSPAASELMICARSVLRSLSAEASA